VQVLPTLITLGNVLSGFLAISYVVDAWGQPTDSAARELLWERAAWVIFLGMLCDTLDGRVARLTGAASAFGAELDSLADMITFGVAPALLAKSVAQDTFAQLHPKFATLLAMFYVLGASLRLARYNVESNRVSAPGHVTKVFRGLPSPGAAGVVASLVLLRHEYGIRHAVSLLADPLVYVLAAGLPVLGLLMISRFAFPHVVNRYLGGAKSPFAIVILLLAVVLIVEQPYASLAGIFVGYALSGPVIGASAKLFGRPRWAVDEDDDEEDEEESEGPDEEPA
jgi:CDP-diacylglycerol--serine O-phosphatidyltransferase